MSINLYQGCAGVVDGLKDHELRLSALDRMEKSGDWIAEEKYDGIWIAAINKTAEYAHPIFLSRNGKQKSIPALSKYVLPPMTTIVGELAYGSQTSLKRRKEVGHDFMDVFDILQYQNENISVLNRKERQKCLDDFYLHTTSHNSDDLFHRFFQRAPAYSRDFVKQYIHSAEGLVLKPVDDPAYQLTGGKVTHWLKAKKCMSDEYVIVNWKLSDAVTKTHTPMAKHMCVGGYVPDTQVGSSYVYDTMDIAGKKFCLIELVHVGSMDNSVCEAIARDFSAWDRKVISVGHFGRFDSGSCRHPFVMKDEFGNPWVRSDKLPQECIYRV